MKKRIRTIICLICVISLVLPFGVFALDEEDAKIVDETVETQTEEEKDETDEKYEKYISGRLGVNSSSVFVTDDLRFFDEKFVTDNGTVEQARYFEYTPDKDTLPAVSYGAYLYGHDTVGSHVASEEKKGSRVVAAVNADFFSMATGVPMSAMIKDGKLVSSDDGRYCVGFDEDGNARIIRDSVTVSIHNEEKNVGVEYFNKYPTEYALYLLDDSFSDTTRSTKSSVEYVFMPYFEKHELTDSEIEENVPDEASDEISQEVKESVPDEIPTREYITQTEGGVIIGDVQYDVGYFDVTTDCDIPVVLTEVRYGSTNSPIPKGHFVLCAENVNQCVRTNMLVLGEELTVSFRSGGGYDGIVNAVGSGGLIVSDGKYTDEFSEPIYYTKDPRTAIGIRADGSVVLYTVECNKGTSGGLTVEQLAYELIRLGCETAVNFDGGNSSVVYLALGGDGKAKRVSIPSDGIERRVANALLFVNKTEKTGVAKEAYLPENGALVMAHGGMIKLSDILTYDENYYPTGTAENTDLTADGALILDGNVFFSQDAGKIPVYAEVAGEKRVAGYINVSDEKCFDYFDLSGYGFDVSPVESFNISVTGMYKNEKVHMGTANLSWFVGDDYMPFNEYEENMRSLMDSVYDLDCAEFSKRADRLSKVRFSYDESELLRPTADSAVYGGGASVDAYGNITPLVDGETLYITAKLGDETALVKINVAPYPFADTKEHWAKKYAYYMYQNGSMLGEEGKDGRYFFPERDMTLAEFFTVLARMTGISPKDEHPLFSNDAEFPDWSRDAIYALDGIGALDAIKKVSSDGTTLDAKKKITRLEAMLVLGRFCEMSASDNVGNYTDLEDRIPKGEYDYANAALSAQLLKGYGDGTIRPDVYLTRAEAATVLSRLSELICAKQ